MQKIMNRMVLKVLFNSEHRCRCYVRRSADNNGLRILVFFPGCFSSFIAEGGGRFMLQNKNLSKTQQKFGGARRWKDDDEDEKMGLLLLIVV